MDKLYHKTISGTLTCKTGLRIGGSKDDIEIGGMENPIIRHPITDLPYIPGSSIKGKVRSLLEYKYGRRDRNGRPKGERDEDNGEPCECGQCMVCRVFGPHKNVRHSLGPTRILVRDAHLTEESEAKLKHMREEKGLVYAEVKTENIIDRRTGIAADKGLRTQERVPADTQFKYEIAVRIFDGDDEKKIMDFVNEGLDLLEADYLGGSGSRGYGKISLTRQVS